MAELGLPTWQNSHCLHGIFPSRARFPSNILAELFFPSSALEAVSAFHSRFLRLPSCSTFNSLLHLQLPPPPPSTPSCSTFNSLLHLQLPPPPPSTPSSTFSSLLLSLQHPPPPPITLWLGSGFHSSLPPSLIPSFLPSPIPPSLLPCLIHFPGLMIGR